jgi:hypothetical protein
VNDTVDHSDPDGYRGEESVRIRKDADVHRHDTINKGMPIFRHKTGKKKKREQQLMGYKNEKRIKRSRESIDPHD